LGQSFAKLCFFAWVVFRIHLKPLGLARVDKLDNMAGVDLLDSAGLAGLYLIGNGLTPTTEDTGEQRGTSSSFASAELKIDLA
jgi:hypothetical protein